MRLTEQRTALCDLLIGRRLRARAEEQLAQALWCEQHQAYRSVVDEQLAQAAHWEWIATISERGQVFWGNRHNRCGSVEDVDPPLDVFATVSPFNRDERDAPSFDE